jgi:hypothetical protein
MPKLHCGCGTWFTGNGLVVRNCAIAVINAPVEMNRRLQSGPDNHGKVIRVAGVLLG